MSQSQFSPENDRRRHADRRSTRPATVLRRYIATGGWVGNALFVCGGALTAISFGGLGGRMFIADLYPLNQGGPLWLSCGSAVGIALCLLAMWALCAVCGGVLGAVAFWIRFRRFPDPE